MASTALFVVFLVEFLLLAPAASSTFFILMAMALVDVVAGFTISITGAGRDVTMGRLGLRYRSDSRAACAES